jgi:hypothetical protein
MEGSLHEANSGFSGQPGSEQIPGHLRRAGFPCEKYVLAIGESGWYMIDMRSARQQGDLHDPFLILTTTGSRNRAPGNAREREVTYDDDSGGNLNARIREVYLEVGTEYFLYATSYDRNDLGRYTISLRRVR